jgi:hypothetical protein
MDLIVGTVGLFINQKFDNVHTKKKKKTQDLTRTYGNYNGKQGCKAERIRSVVN